MVKINVLGRFAIHVPQGGNRGRDFGFCVHCNEDLGLINCRGIS
jgi:hypothetical protein